ncbi:hypothetical protein CEE37_11965 [candidate division LCP-89 bacterium B3_LCP]|uniref:HTH marR-type domain-containing protein n=1 Tax=candidate division LCP-89 bacterium B3_LCP TaxID=2012998 RepID=A0A532UW13_UNCL8|nr:MAG: hypothetical protein CEE37_11965 [candidate division LCP-89 bacterium B3_LCP]
MNDRAFQFYELLKDITSCCQEREILQAAKYNLTISEARCLISLELNACKTTADLADNMLVAKSRVTRVVDGLVKKGLVGRCEDKDDRRICQVSLTNEGNRIAVDLFGFILSLHEEVLGKLPDDLRDDTITNLSLLRDAMHHVKDRLIA